MKSVVVLLASSYGRNKTKTQFQDRIAKSLKSSWLFQSLNLFNHRYGMRTRTEMKFLEKL
jgi:hypothetical protein